MGGWRRLLFWGGFRLACGSLKRFSQGQEGGDFCWVRLRTRDDQSLAGHDEDDLHRPELIHVHFPSLIQCESKLRDEGGAEPTDADRGRDVRRVVQQLEGRLVGQGDDEFGIFNAESESEPYREKGRQNRNPVRGQAVATRKRAADDADLE